MRGLDQPEPGSITHDPWTAGCFQSPARTTLSLHVSCFLSASLYCPLLFPDSSVWKESACNVGDPGSIPGSERSPWRRDRLPTPVFLGFACGSAGKESAYNVEDHHYVPGSGISPGEGIGCPLQYSWAFLVAQTVKNPPAMWETWVEKIFWRRAWQPTPVFLPGESPWTEEPGRLQSIGSQRVGHN